MSALTDQTLDAPRPSQTEQLRALAAIHGDTSALDGLEEWWTEAPAEGGRASEQR